jgi:disulfide bond formation protein DsbB
VTLGRIAASIGVFHEGTMTTLFSPVKDWKWPVVAMLISAAMLAAAHSFERFGGLYPCPLCLRQRDVYWAMIAMVLTGLALWKIRPARRFLVALNVLVGLVFVTGAVVATYHAGVEWAIFPPPAGCSAGPPVDPMVMGDLSGPIALPACTDAPGYVLGLSMAGWNVVISVGLALLSFLAAARTWRG